MTPRCCSTHWETARDSSTHILLSSPFSTLSMGTNPMQPSGSRLTPSAHRWPDMYVNPDDGICRGHIDYFQQRERVAEKHPSSASTAMSTSYRDIFTGKLRPHLLPSATLWINSNKEDPHGLKHWWKSDTELNLERKVFRIP